MSIKKLGKEIRSRLSATSKINSYKRAIEELVYNSLDSDSTSIAIRIDIHESFIQVIDNGSGISKSDICLLGQRYATSKAVDMPILRGHSNKYGFRGESLANIIEVSSQVKITSRYEKSDETWIKYFSNGQHRDSYMTTKRPSKGTTVEIKGFLYNLHIQKKETNNVTEIQNIKIFLQQISLERTNISMSFRDNSRNEIIFSAHKSRDTYQTLSSVFEIDRIDIQELQVEKNEYKVKGFVGKNEDTRHSYKWIYLNGRIVHKSALHDILNEYFRKTYNWKKSMKKNSQNSEISFKEIPFYFIFISCPHLDYDILFNPGKTFIQFKDWNQIELILEKFVQFFTGNIKLKEMSVKVVKDKKIAGNTQEEARKIMEKILGNKSQIQMDKGVEGKTVRKRTKQKNNYHEACNKKFKSKYSSVAQVLNPPQNTSICTNLENIRIEDSDKALSIKTNHNKIKKSKVKNDKFSPYIDPVIKKFTNITDSVKQRCDIYSDNIKQLLTKKINSVCESVGHTNKRDDEIRLDGDVKEVYETQEKSLLIHRDMKITKENLDEGVMYLAKAKKGYLRSYDLVKTILNTQKDFSRIEDNPNQSTQKTFEYTDLGCNSYNNIDATNIKSNVTSPFTKVTFDSHKYQHRNTFVSKIKQRKISRNNLYNLSVRKEVTQSICKTKFNNRICNNYLMKNNYMESNTHNINKYPCSKLDDLFDMAEHNEEGSYNIDKFLSKHNAGFIARQNIYSHDRWNYEVTGNIRNTYTVTKDSNISINIESYINNKHTIRKTYEKSIVIEDEENSETFSHLSEENLMRNSNHNLYSREISKGCSSKILFTPYSENLDSQMIINSCIEPLTVCEAVYDNYYNINSQIGNTYTLNNMNREIESISSHSSILETSKVNDDCMLVNDMDDKSHHFGNASNFKLHSHLVQSQVNKENENNFEKEAEINSKVDAINEKYDFESLDFYFESFPDWTDIVNQNEVSNNFNIQDRHNFLPKGMSQIFANCNTKKVCSYDLEMDYFRDDLYNEFADNVLENFNLFESRIQNIKDNVPKNFAHLNKKLKTDSASLKFNACSLKKAKVFGQVDNKYIAAELHIDNDSSLKYLVLFDQHAVHERITLEENLSDYIKDDQWISADCGILAVKLTKENVIYLNNYRDKFCQLGLKWMFENDLVLFNGIPKAILGKHCRQADVVLTCIKNLITEEVKAIKCLKGNLLLYPKSIMDLVFSEACRYAIKFGDVLSKDKCAMLIESLSTCKTPFQCAHGRPVMAVLLNMKTIDDKYTINMSSISIFRNKVMK